MNYQKMYRKIRNHFEETHTGYIIDCMVKENGDVLTLSALEEVYSPTDYNWTHKVISQDVDLDFFKE